MEPISAAVLPTDAPPVPGTQLVVFADRNPYTPETLARQMLSRAIRYARRHRVYLVPQRFLAQKRLCVCLLSPEGTLLGVQEATHLNLDYRAERFYRADAVLPFQTPLGRVALLSDVDVFMPHVVRQAVLQGAELLLSSCYIQPFDLTADLVRNTAEAAAHSNGVPLAGSLSGCGMVCPPKGPASVSSFEDSPVYEQILPAVPDGDLRAEMEEAQALLRNHHWLFAGDGGGTGNV